MGTKLEDFQAAQLKKAATKKNRIIGLCEQISGELTEVIEQSEKGSFAEFKLRESLAKVVQASNIAKEINE